ncbi:MAG: CxxC-x17-CxxC domain-containing protein [Candidatus Omnitrophota bacterium]
MKKSLKRKSLVTAPQPDEPSVADLINKLQQQLSDVVKKLDILISQSEKKPFEKNYSQKPPQSFDRFHRHDRGRRDEGRRERTYTRVVCADCGNECEIPFKPSGDRPVYCKECFAKRKQGGQFSPNRDNRPQERDFSRERNFDKTRLEKRQKPGKKKKPFFAHAKKRA